MWVSHSSTSLQDNIPDVTGRRPFLFNMVVTVIMVPFELKRSSGVFFVRHRVGAGSTVAVAIGNYLFHFLHSFGTAIDVLSAKDETTGISTSVARVRCLIVFAVNAVTKIGPGPGCANG